MLSPTAQTSTTTPTAPSKPWRTPAAAFDAVAIPPIHSSIFTVTNKTLITLQPGGKHRADLTYNTTKGFWACCGVNPDGTANCHDQTDEIFPAPPPTWLTTIQYLPPEGTPTYATSPPTSTPHSSSSTSAVSAGTAAGIGIGAGLGVVFLAGAIAFFFLRDKKKPLPANQSTYYYPVQDQTPLNAPPSLSHRSWQSSLVEPQSSAVYELGKTREPSEIDTAYQPHGR